MPYFPVIFFSLLPLQYCKVNPTTLERWLQNKAPKRYLSGNYKPIYKVNFFCTTVVQYPNDLLTFRNSITSGMAPARMSTVSEMPAVQSSQVHSLTLFLLLRQTPRPAQMPSGTRNWGQMARPTRAQWRVRTASQRAGSSQVGQRASTNSWAWVARLSSVWSRAESLAREKLDITNVLFIYYSV